MFLNEPWGIMDQWMTRVRISYPWAYCSLSIISQHKHLVASKATLECDSYRRIQHSWEPSCASDLAAASHEVYFLLQNAQLSHFEDNGRAASEHFSKFEKSWLRFEDSFFRLSFRGNVSWSIKATPYALELLKIFNLFRLRATDDARFVENAKETV